MSTPKTIENISISPTLASHITRFLIYNMAFALLPLFFNLLLRATVGVQPTPGVYAPELLIFGVVISATALGDLSDESRIFGSAPRIQLIRALLLLGAIMAAGFFGLFQYDAIFGSANSTFRNNITPLALILGVVLFAASISAEILVGKIRGQQS